MRITYYECVCVCVCVRERERERVRVRVCSLTQHARRMRRVTLSTVASLAPLYFSTLSHKQHDFRTKITEHKIGVLIFSTTFV